MTNGTNISGGRVVSLASKMIRCLLILPLIALLLPGNHNSSIDNWGCIAFQHHRHPATTKKGYGGSGFDQRISGRGLLNDAINAASPSTNYFWSNAKKASRLSFRMAATESERDNGEDEAEKIAKLTAEVEAKRDSAQAEAKRLMVEAQKAAKLKVEQDEKLKEAQEMLALLQAEAEARKKTQEETAKQQAVAEEKKKQAEEEAAQLKAKAEAEEEKKKLKAQKAEEEAAKRIAEAEEKLKQAEKEAAKLKAEAEAEQEKQRLKAQKKAEELSTLLKAKEEAARVMAEIDAKLQEQTVEADEEEAERLQTLQSDAEQTLDLDDETDEMLKKMMEEMEKVKIELDARLKAEAEEATTKAKAEEKVRIKKAEEEAAAKAIAEEQARVKKVMEETAAKAKAEEKIRAKKVEQDAAAKAKGEEEAKAKAASEEETSDPVSDLMNRIKDGANYDPVSKTVTAEQVKEIPPPKKSKPKNEVIDTTSTSHTPTKPMPMPDLPSTSKEKPETKKKVPKEESKPKWMVDWKDKNTKDGGETKAKNSTEGKDKKKTEGNQMKDKETVEDEPIKKDMDPRTKGRSRKENLFDVIGRTATGGVTMDEITKHKKKKPEGTPPKPPPEVLNELKKKGPSDSFGESVAASYQTGEPEKEGSRRVMPELENIKELKKKGPPASFGKFAEAASTTGTPPNTDDTDDTFNFKDKGPPASFGVTVAMASSGEVPKDLLSRGTASTDVGASAPPKPPPSTSRKPGPDSNIIDVVDVEYTKKDVVPKAKKASLSRPRNSAPPLEVEKTVPPAPPLQVERTVSPMKNPPKKKPPMKKPPKKKEGEKKATAAEANTSSATNPIKNIGKAAVGKIFGQKNKEAEKETEPKATKEDSKDKKVDGGEEKAMEDRVADLLKEAFSLSKEDSRVADLLKGVVAITTGKEDKKKKKESKTPVKKTSAKGRKRARQVAVEEEIEEEEEEEEDFDEEDFEDDEDNYDDGDYDDVDDDEENDFDEEDEATVIMGRGIGRNRRMEDRVDFERNTNRRDLPNRGMGNNRVENVWGDDRNLEDPRSSRKFDDNDRGEYFVDDDDEYIKYDENDRWQGRGPGSRRPQPPMEPGGYSVRPPPPPQSRGQPGPEDDDDYYFLQFGSPNSRSPPSRYDEPGGDRYYDYEDDYDKTDDYDGPQPGAPRPAFVDDSKKGPPSSFGNFVADASMSKTGFAPTSLKDDDDQYGGSGSEDREEFGEEMSSSTGSMLKPRGVNRSGRDRSAPSQGRSAKPHFEVSEDDSDGRRGNKKGPPSSFGKSVTSAGEGQTGYSMPNIEDEIANGGMATPTGGMASPRRRMSTNPATDGGNTAAPSGGAGRGTVKKDLFVVSDEDSGPADFGSSVAEASGSRTGWAPKAPTRATGSIDGGTIGGMRPKIQKPSNPESSTPQKKDFGSTVFDDCPPLDSKKKGKSQVDLPLARKPSTDSDLNQKHQRNPVINLIDGGASKNPPRQVQFGGSMMAPRIRRNESPAETEEGDTEDGEEAK